MEAHFASPQHEWWPRPSDGRLVPLVLQTNDEPHLLPQTPRWTRIGKILSRVSPILLISYWAGSSLFVPGTRKYRINIKSLALTAIKLLIAWPLLCILIFWIGYHGLPYFDALNADSMSRYDAVRVQQNEDVDSKHDLANQIGSTQGTRSTSPPSEADSEIESSQQYQDNIRLTEASTSSAVLGMSSDSARADEHEIPASVRPRYLCFVKDFKAGTYETVKVSDYLKQNGDDVDLEFVFVSYTRMQFRVATEEEIVKFPYPDEATRDANRKLARRDREMLARWGMDAAHKVGKRAFWLDFECVRNDDGIARSTSSSEDVYRICDIVRAAHSMIIAIGPTTNDKVASILAGEESFPYSREYVTPWLRQWGSRLWTLPELLLCPGEYRIRLYVVGDPSEPKEMAKRNFAERAWDDAEAVKELVNHFEGSAILTSQHLIEAALNCFSRRQTDQFSQGDIAYATMGLFPNRHRPRVNKNDTGFQAFAKLSLANDSGAFLERLICLAPKPGAPWHQTEDHWGVRLSDIHPNNKVYGVLASDTILLDGVFGATIQWDDLRPEPVIDRRSGKFLTFYIMMAFALCLMMPLMCAFFYTSNALTRSLFTAAASAPTSALSIILGCGLSLMAILAGLAPLVLITSRGSPKQPFKARLIGIEGMVDAGTVEKHLWGFNHGNLVDTTPSSYRDVDEPHESPSPALAPGENESSFTLVDTYLMTVTHYRCSLPPTAMLIFGQEDGMQRTLLCSYNWRTETFHRQTVLRVNRQGLDQMHRVDRIRFSLAPHPKPTSSLDNGLPSVPERRQPPITAPTGKTVPKRGWRTWKREFLFFAICLFTINLRDIHTPSLRYSNLGSLLGGISWVVSQILGVGLLSRLPLSQVFGPVLVAKRESFHGDCDVPLLRLNYLK
ncbi:hypothetical protein N8I77_009792 [Diaporthe amygdali]|uniref:3-hydroxyisobutyrate dehydrogenase protein n=1 Tax=Phomopsis amygdali TaxID=1214568 RepID=A0AAD9SBW2_PHOAM|nr:hypothetical protein N8I77_009792 [Diaporthe amygdali]